MIIGAHLANRPHLTDDERRRFARARFSGAMPLWYQDPQEIARLTQPAHCVVRLPDSVYTKWPEDHKYIPSSHQYADDLVKEIARWYGAGFRQFVPDCEPNQSWPTCGQGAWEWAYFMNEVLYDPAFGVRNRVPADVELGLTAFSNTDWTTWLAASAPLVPRLQFVSVHSYWQALPDMYSEIFGMQASFVYKRFGKPVVITEAGNSIIQSTPAPELRRVEQLMVQQYPMYLFWLTKPEYFYVRGVYFFMLGGTEDWRGFDLTPAVCDAIAAWQVSTGRKGDGMYRSPNFDTPSGVRKPTMAVIHITEGSYPGDVEYLCNPRPGGDPRKAVSCHKYVRRNGEIIELVDDNNIAWTQGLTADTRANRPDLWNLHGWGNPNEYCLSIECEAEVGQLVTPQQMDACVSILTTWCKKYPTLKPDRLHIVGHYEINVHKTDPTRPFDWTGLMARLNANLAPPAPPTVRTFPQTGQTVRGPFLEFFDANGGVGRIGFPLTGEEHEGDLIVQFFENRRMEFKQAPGYPRFGAVGRMYLQAVGRLK